MIHLCFVRNNKNTQSQPAETHFKECRQTVTATTWNIISKAINLINLKTLMCDKYIS